MEPPKQFGEDGEEVEDARSILQQAVAEIRNVRAKLKTCSSVVDVDVALQRAEAELICKAKEKASLELENVDANIVKRHPCRITRTRFVPDHSSRRSGNKTAGLPGRGRAQERLIENHINNPTSKAAREYLQDRYGIDPPRDGGPVEGEAASIPINQLVKKGLTCHQPIVLPRWIRDDPFQDPMPEMSSQEIHKGILHLMNKGLLPHYVDISSAISGGSWVVRTLRAYLHPYEYRHEKKPVTTALEDNMLAQGSRSFKLDVLTPIRMPTFNQGQVTETTDKQQKVEGNGGAATSFDANQGKDEKGPRLFCDLMDDHSLHHVMIRRGCVVDTTPEFASFHRTYQEIWPFIADMILQLEGVCSQYAVPTAILDGRAVAETVKATLAMGEPCPMEDLLACVVNIQELALILKQPGRRFLGIHGKQEAATMIQSRFRGFKARSVNPRIDKMRAAAKSVQEAWRLNRIRTAAIQKIRKARETRDRLFQELHHKLTSDWQDIQKRSHVVVHVPSVSGRDMAALRSEHQEVLQMARLCDTADTNVDVVYIAALDVDKEVEGYWKKLLEVGGVEDPPSRYRIIHPENAARLPSQMSLTAKLLCSPRALQRICNFIHGRPAYIIPGIVGDEDISLSVKLRIPLLAPHPHHRQAVMVRSGARAVFKNAGVMTAPSHIFSPVRKPQVDIETSPLRPGTNFSISQSGNLVISEEEQQSESAANRRPRNDGFLIKGIAEFLVENPHWLTWSINVENDIWGRGAAHFDLSEIEDARSALDRYMNVSTDPRSTHVIQEAAEVAVHGLELALTKHLPKGLKIVRKDFYPTYRAFVQAVCSNGGVLEAVPDRTTGCPSVNLFIEPTGAVRVFSTHEKIFYPAYVAVGNSFPQCSVPHIALHDAAMAIGFTCHNLGITGHIGASFVVFKDGGQLRMWATELCPFPTLSLASYQLFDFLTAGEFDPRIGAYLVPDDEESEASFEEKVRQELATENHGEESTGLMGIEGIDDDVEGDPSELGDDSQKPWIIQRRYFVAIDGVVHPLLRKLQYASFFHSCRIHGMCFDMQGRIGTAFNVVDGFASGVLGVLCVGFSPSETFNELCDVLDFICGQVSGIRKQMTLKGGSMAEEYEGDAKTLNGIRITVKYLADRLKRKTQDRPRAIPKQ